MPDANSLKHYTFSQIVAAVEIFQKAGYVASMKNICDELGFSMVVSNPRHSQIISNYLNDALSGKNGPEPNPMESEPKVFVAQPCPCEDS